MPMQMQTLRRTHRKQCSDLEELEQMGASAQCDFTMMGSILSNSRTPSSTSLDEAIPKLADTLVGSIRSSSSLSSQFSNWSRHTSTSGAFSFTGNCPAAESEARSTSQDPIRASRGVRHECSTRTAR
ncbi:Uncharacterized protein HZ326_5281 [Fusarium oxysporum f. sp. albedinis]|nr:Uncharacterized protein HZ326_5281 [Fusarium oxysporum f. sp. albedinis]